MYVLQDRPIIRGVRPSMNYSTATANRAFLRAGTTYPNFMSRRDPGFREETGALQVKSRELREQGVGAIVKHAAVVSPDEEGFVKRRCLEIIRLRLSSVLLCGKSVLPKGQ